MERSGRASLPSQRRMPAAIIEVIRRLGGQGTNDEIDRGVAEYYHISKEMAERQHPRSRYTELSYRCAWGRTYLRRVGLLESAGRKVWRLASAAWSDDAVAERLALIRAIYAKK